MDLYSYNYQLLAHGVKIKGRDYPCEPEEDIILPDGRGKDKIRFQHYLIFSNGTIEKKLRRGDTFGYSQAITFYFDHYMFRVDRRDFIKAIFHEFSGKKSIFPDGRGRTVVQFEGQLLYRTGEIVSVSTGQRLSRETEKLNIKSGQIRIDRAIYEIYSGSRIPSGYKVIHKNGDIHDNSFENLFIAPFDRARKGPKRVLTKEDCINIISEKKLGAKCIELAAKYSTSPATISRVLQGKYPVF